MKHESISDESQASPEERIRMRAYYLWEQAADPKGTPDEYWEQARQAIDSEAPPVESGSVNGAQKK
ncbi:MULTISPECIES: DUF2934 domain-containing protein [Paraburkholderia]|uniref:DUF2934 domain-containing protein n=1 Tax=Paraburkholderia acidicola TaxID=1912599 RepID=A0ABV1LYX1_9BURK